MNLQDVLAANSPNDMSAAVHAAGAHHCRHGDVPVDPNALGGVLHGHCQSHQPSQGREI